jgi:alpha-D-ribose 1-methylphosphonate 5-triphosphate synthase subunit PhnH
MELAVRLTPDAHRDQSVFRALINCMSRPGTIGSLPLNTLQSSPNPAVTAIVRCLVDHEVSFSVVNGDRVFSEQLLRFTGSRQAEPDSADFIIEMDPTSIDAVNSAKIGTDEFPNESATVIVSVDSLASGPLTIHLTGPGVKSRRSLPVRGVTSAVVRAISDRNQDFPLGIDVVLVDADGRIACIPRTSAISCVPDLVAS